MSTGRHRAPRSRGFTWIRFIEDTQIRMMLRGSWLGEGFCLASIDGYCVGGTADGCCHG